MKLDMGRAWNDAMAMLKQNRDVTVAVAGLFLFLPVFGLFLLLMHSGISLIIEGQEPDPEFVNQQIVALFTGYWWAFLGVVIAQIFGSVVLMRVLADPARPTVSEALASVPGMILTIIAAQILISLATQALPLLGSVLPPAAEALVSLISLPIVFYLTIKFMLMTPIIAIDRERNPIKVLQRSWSLTRNNSFRLFGFMALLIVVGLVLGLLATLIISVVLALFSERIASIGIVAFLALVIALAYAIGYAVTASIHAQLSGRDLNQSWEDFA
ncbi:glycerophosphoryl diester phosphodiesterase membrane domain-containing protein [Altererythrobacter sp. GH1-8]|uniref:glycerophosphoryl diester phosphodiesterase membrane domain-containing protein n=1 Tax=Altererythrobacter sp. GH1-8 TaxID=3349333 RepID=UPI00374D5EB1